MKKFLALYPIAVGGFILYGLHIHASPFNFYYVGGTVLVLTGIASYIIWELQK